MRRDLELNEGSGISGETGGSQRISRAKKSLQVPLDPTDFQSISAEAERSGLSMPEIVRRRIKSSTDAENELKGIIDKVLALEDAGFVLSARTEKGESIALQPLSLFILPTTSRIARAQQKP